MINDPIYGQILYNCCLSNAFKLKLGHNEMIFGLEMMKKPGVGDCQAHNWNEKGNSTSRVQATREQLLIIIHRLSKVLKRVKRG